MTAAPDPPGASTHEEAGDGSRSPGRLIAGEAARFVIVGGINTSVTYVIYLAMLNWLRYEIAYAVGYVAGIAVAYALNTAFVFRRPIGLRSAVRFPLVYVAQFFISLGFLHLAVEVLDVPRWLALAFSVALTLPITFVLSRWIVRAG